MKLSEFLNPTLGWRSLVALGTICFVGGPIVYALIDPYGALASFESIESKAQEAVREHKSEPEVIGLFGQDPAYRYEGGEAPSDYYVDGWSRRERPIAGSVLIFILGEPICYVWFDAGGRAEEFFVGGS